MRWALFGMVLDLVFYCHLRRFQRLERSLFIGANSGRVVGVCVCVLVCFVSFFIHLRIDKTCMYYTFGGRSWLHWPLRRNGNLLTVYLQVNKKVFPFRKSFLSGSFLPINYGLASALISCAQVRRSLVLHTSCLFSDLRESNELYRRCSIELKTWRYPSDLVKWSSNETTETKNVLHGLLSRVIITGYYHRFHLP